MSSIFYAQLDSDSVCLSITEYGQVLDNPPSTYIEIDSFDKSYIGQTWNGSAWVKVVRSDTVVAREWRDQELRFTDWIVPLSDHPERAAYMTYRTALRDWPSTSDFPDTKPELGD